MIWASAVLTPNNADPFRSRFFSLFYDMFPSFAAAHLIILTARKSISDFSLSSSLISIYFLFLKLKMFMSNVFLAHLFSDRLLLTLVDPLNIR
jgi:hypothetical protein